MKTISAVCFAAAVLGTSVYAAGPDPSGDRETVARNCLTRAGFSEARSVAEYEAVRFSKPGVFYFGTKIWLSSGSDLTAARPCLQAVGAK